MKLFFAYLREHIRTIAVFVLFSALLAASFALYKLPVQAVLYPVGLCTALGAAFVIVGYIRAARRHAEFASLNELTAAEERLLPPERSIDDADYRRIIALLAESRARIQSDAQRTMSEAIDYYTVWVHQIKTPIASMRLTLQNEDSPQSRRLSSDYVIREFELDPLIRQSVKKFAGDFIGRHISLELTPTDERVISDEKWLAFVIEQVLSNALKYTKTGSVKIYMAQPKTLCICDTGIGIAPEDLPRIFEKGYTGYNGRSDKRASGLGLYLCRSICSKLGHGISAVSAPDSGTEFRIDLSTYALSPE